MVDQTNQMPEGGSWVDHAGRFFDSFIRIIIENYNEEGKHRRKGKDQFHLNNS